MKNTLNKAKIIEISAKEGRITTVDLSERFGVSKQYVNQLIHALVKDGKLLKVGSTRSAFYVQPSFASKHIEIFPNKLTRIYSNIQLEEHKVLDAIENSLPILLHQHENIRSIFTYAFSEMLNNAIEHSTSKKIQVEISIEKGVLVFIITDFGIGVFRNVMKNRALNSEVEAIQDILKGKTTTQPQAHSGEGIFFTSKAADEFSLESYGFTMIVNNTTDDLFVGKNSNKNRGTRVTFKLSLKSQKHLRDIFQSYTSEDENGVHGFDKTEVKIKLYLMTGIHVSRSQARRVLTGLEKFNVITFDFEKVPMIGQAFADEIFRVFHNKYPTKKLLIINTNEAVKFMIDRVEGNNPRSVPIQENTSE